MKTIITLVKTQCGHVVSNVFKSDRWSLPLLWHLSDIKAIPGMQLQILRGGGQLTPLCPGRPEPLAREDVRRLQALYTKSPAHTTDKQLILRKQRRPWQNRRVTTYRLTAYAYSHSHGTAATQLSLPVDERPACLRRRDLPYTRCRSHSCRHRRMRVNSRAPISISSSVHTSLYQFWINHRIQRPRESPI